MPALIGGYRARLASSSPMIFTTGSATQTVVSGGVALLLQVREQVDDLRQRKLLWRGVHVLLPDQMRFPVPPFHSREPVGDVGGEAFAVGSLLLAKEKIRLVDAVDGTILRHLRPGEVREGRVKVDDVNDLLLTRPAGTLPGQRTMNGVRSEPSIAVK